MLVVTHYSFYARWFNVPMTPAHVELKVGLVLSLIIIVCYLNRIVGVVQNAVEIMRKSLNVSLEDAADILNDN